MKIHTFLTVICWLAYFVGTSITGRAGAQYLWMNSSQLPVEIISAETTSYSQRGHGLPPIPIYEYVYNEKLYELRGSLFSSPGNPVKVIVPDSNIENVFLEDELGIQTRSITGIIIIVLAMALEYGLDGLRYKGEKVAEC